MEVKVNSVTTLKIADMLWIGSTHLVYLKNPTQLQISGESMTNGITNLLVYEVTDNIASKIQ